MKANITVLFALSAIAAGAAAFAKLTITATDSSGATVSTDITSTDTPVTNPDGSLQYVVPVDVAAGSVSMTAQAFDTNGAPLGTSMSGSGTLTSGGGSGGLQFPQVSSLSIAAA